MKLWQRTNSITHANLWFLIQGADSYKSASSSGVSCFRASATCLGDFQKIRNQWWNVAHTLRYFCSQHPGAACWRAESLLLATRHQSFINQPQDLFLTTFLTFTQYFSFFITPRKNKSKGSPVSRPPFRKTELDLWKCFYAVIFDLV